MVGVIAVKMEERLKKAIKIIKRVVDEQAEDEGLWFIAETCSEAYLQQELRRLHFVIEQNLSGIKV